MVQYHRQSVGDPSSVVLWPSLCYGCYHHSGSTQCGAPSFRMSSRMARQASESSRHTVKLGSLAAPTSAASDVADSVLYAQAVGNMFSGGPHDTDMGCGESIGY